jgi:hypothetical protein
VAEAHDRVHLEQRDRRRRALEIDLVEDSLRQRVRVHLQADLQRSRRVHALLDDLVQAKRVGPELLVAECLEAEDALALGDEGGFTLLSHRAGWRRRRLRPLGSRLRRSACADRCSRDQREHDPRWQSDPRRAIGRCGRSHFLD